MEATADAYVIQLTIHGTDERRMFQGKKYYHSLNNLNSRYDIYRTYGGCYTGV